MATKKGSEGAGGGGTIETTKEIAKTITGAKALVAVTEKLKATVNSLAEPFESAASAGDEFAKSLGASGGFMDWTAAATSVDALRAEIERATGASEKFTGMSIGLQSELTALGISLKDSKDAVVDLFNNFSEFTMLGKETQKEIAKQALQFTKLGIAVGQTTKSYDTLMKGMGMSAKEAEKTNKDLAKLAKQIGVAPAKMSKDFTDSAKTLARYGKGGVQVFKQLAVQSKATGLDMSKLLNVAEKFDTFQSAAEAAGNLNAMLGGNLVNSVDMLTASEGDRIDMLRNAMFATGKSWDMLDRFEKKSIAGAVGISDMTDAMRLFGTEQATLEDLEDKADPALVAQQNLNEAMQRGTKIAEQWNASFEALGVMIGQHLTPLMKELTSFITGKEGLGGPGVKKIFTFIVDKIKALSGWWKKLSPEVKDTVRQVAQFAIKAWALSAAFVGVKKIATPLMELLSNPWAGVILSLGIVIAHWDDLGALWKKITGYVVNLDNKIEAFFARNKNNAFVAALADSYRWLKEKIPEAVEGVRRYMSADAAEGGGLVYDFIKFRDVIKNDVWPAVKEFFSGMTGEVDKFKKAAGGEPGKPFSIFDMMSGFWDKLKEKFNDIMGWFAGIEAWVLDMRQITARGEEDRDLKVAEIRARQTQFGFKTTAAADILELQNILARDDDDALKNFQKFASDKPAALKELYRMATGEEYAGPAHVPLHKRTGSNKGPTPLEKWFLEYQGKDLIGELADIETRHDRIKPVKRAAGGPIMVGEYGPERIMAAGGGVFVEPHSAVSGDEGKPTVFQFNIDGKRFAEATYKYNKEVQEDREGFNNISWA